MTSTTLKSIISGYIGTLVGNLNATTPNPSVRINPMPKVRTSSGELEPVTTLPVSISSETPEDISNKLGYEEFQLENGTEQPDGSGLYDTVVRGIGNKEITSPATPANGNSEWYRNHFDGDSVIIDPTFDIRALATEFELAVDDLGQKNQSAFIDLEIEQALFAERERVARENFERDQINDDNSRDLNNSVFQDEARAAQEAFESNVQNQLSAGVNGQIVVQLKWTDETQTTFDIVGGGVVIGTNFFDYLGSTAQALPGATTYYELDSTAGLVTNTSGFTAGFFPIGRITKSGSVYTIENFESKGGSGGGFKNVSSMVYDGSGRLSTFTADGLNWIVTYNSDGTVNTVTRGSEVTTITYNADGTAASITTV